MRTRYLEESSDLFGKWSFAAFVGAGVGAGIGTGIGDGTGTGVDAKQLVQRFSYLVSQGKRSVSRSPAGVFARVAILHRA